MARGRPSKYDPSYCDLLAKHFAAGYSYESFAGRIGVAKQTLYNWEEAHPDFLDAKRDNEARSQFLWEQRLATLADTGEGHPTAIIFGLKNRAPESWRDKTDLDHGGGVVVNINRLAD